jgi:hypothetical protein
MWDLWWTKWRWGRFSPSTSVSPAQFSFHKLLHTHYHLPSGAGTKSQIVADVSTGLSLTPPQETIPQFLPSPRSCHKIDFCVLCLDLGHYRFLCHAFQFSLFYILLPAMPPQLMRMMQHITDNVTFVLLNA